MQVRQGPNQVAIQLLRVGIVFVVRPQPSFHVTDCDLPMKCDKSRRKCGCGVALHQHDIGSDLFQHPRQPLEYSLDDSVQGLGALHDVEIVVRTYLEQR